MICLMKLLCEGAPAFFFRDVSDTDVFARQ
jgi:hypothetical protein